MSSFLKIISFLIDIYKEYKEKEKKKKEDEKIKKALSSKDSNALNDSLF